MHLTVYKNNSQFISDLSLSQRRYKRVEEGAETMSFFHFSAEKKIF